MQRADQSDDVATERPGPAVHDANGAHLARVRVVLPCRRLLTSVTVNAAVDAVAADCPVELWVHPGTRSIGCKCFYGARTRLTAVRKQSGSSASWQMLRRLVVSIGMYELTLVRKIKRCVPEELRDVSDVATRAFEGCRVLESAYIPPSVTSLGRAAFLGCNRLTSVSIPDTVTCVDTNTFAGCTSLASVILPDGVRYIGSGAFAECAGLTRMVLPGTVTTIGRSAFSMCVGLTSVVFPDSVRSIDDFAFFGCKRLTSVELCSTTLLGKGVFIGCGSVAINRRCSPTQHTAAGSKCTDTSCWP
eukprot:m.170153 g.170153  ORF g.170153 m.170153 type:complete len:303 (-) comp24194_c0_seq2:143-1051(-)